ncbi:hypothetical protein FHX06_007148 [Rhizobium sp. BK512]|uniref:chemotaxis protein CheB n=1 Tax=Rhizobium sp. BK512 TaxID=2587010 RepID=UPI001608B19D|nr:chemotaxis protein CheB [Rhizobium sp. BK512]MBB3565775.1 hypothetical protein [Rhizobium sp. BK512]
MVLAIAFDEKDDFHDRRFKVSDRRSGRFGSRSLKVQELDLIHRERKPIDLFFASLAEQQGECAVGIVLSGGDGDGTLGAKAIKEAGGLTLAQGADGSGPKYPDMPQSAIASGMIDITLPVEEMGKRLVAFAKTFDALERITRDSHNREDAVLDETRVQICAILSSHTSHDFAGYKTKTFFRRVRRRMQVLQLTSMTAYIEHLRKDADEDVRGIAPAGQRREQARRYRWRIKVISLFRDLLINVTNFFRDADAFAMLADIVIPKLFEGKGANEAVRVWVPGCATGEEVFSLAILMREYMDQVSISPKV